MRKSNESIEVELMGLYPRFDVLHVRGGWRFQPRDRGFWGYPKFSGCCRSAQELRRRLAALAPELEWIYHISLPGFPAGEQAGTAR